MANQLYAAPIIIEAFQTGKYELEAEYEIQVPGEVGPSPNNGPRYKFYSVRLWTAAMGFSPLTQRAIVGYGRIFISECELPVI
jgi:hypothetical protein